MAQSLVYRVLHRLGVAHEAIGANGLALSAAHEIGGCGRGIAAGQLGVQGGWSGEACHAGRGVKA
ncbi:MAG: hypothetical protein AAGI72_07635 [Pseudomonadota bacterium]